MSEEVQDRIKKMIKKSEAILNAGKEKLKPCPFCGGKAEVASDEYRQIYINPLFGSVTSPAASKAWAYCTECGAMGRVVRDKDYDGYKNVEREERLKEEAIEAWNRRYKEHDDDR